MFGGVLLSLHGSFQKGGSFVVRAWRGLAPPNSEENRALLLVKLLLLLCLALLGLYGSVTLGVVGKGRRARECTDDQRYFECAVWQDAGSLAAFALGTMLCTLLSPAESKREEPGEEDSSSASMSHPGQYRRDEGALAEKLQLYSYVM